MSEKIYSLRIGSEYFIRAISESEYEFTAIFGDEKYGVMKTNRLEEAEKVYSFVRNAEIVVLKNGKWETFKKSQEYMAMN